jgi:hypothetical protein
MAATAVVPKEQNSIEPPAGGANKMVTEVLPLAGPDHGVTS